MSFLKPTNKCLDRTTLAIAEGLARGEGYLEIADRLGLAVHTIHNTSKRLMRNLGMRNRVEFAVAWNCELFQEGLRAMGLIPIPEVYEDL